MTFSIDVLEIFPFKQLQNRVIVSAFYEMKIFKFCLRTEKTGIPTSIWNVQRVSYKKMCTLVRCYYDNRYLSLLES